MKRINTVTIFVPSLGFLVEVKRYKHMNNYVHRFIAKHITSQPAIYVRIVNAYHTPDGLADAWELLTADEYITLPYWHLLTEIQVGCLPELLESE